MIKESDLVQIGENWYDRAKKLFAISYSDNTERGERAARLGFLMAVRVIKIANLIIRKRTKFEQKYPLGGFIFESDN